MKIYAKFNEDAKHVANCWDEMLENQIVNTVAVMTLYGPEWDNITVFPSFEQKDGSAQYITFKGERFYLIPEYFKLLYVWEPKDFEPEACNCNDVDFNDKDRLEEECKKLYDHYCEAVGMEHGQEAEVPDGYVFLGTCYGDEDSLDLSGLAFAEAQEVTGFIEDTVYVLDEKMFG